MATVCLQLSVIRCAERSTPALHEPTRPPARRFPYRWRARDTSVSERPVLVCSVLHKRCDTILAMGRQGRGVRASASRTGGAVPLQRSSPRAGERRTPSTSLSAHECVDDGRGDREQPTRYRELAPDALVMNVASRQPRGPDSVWVRGDGRSRMERVADRKPSTLFVAGHVHHLPGRQEPRGSRVPLRNAEHPIKPRRPTLNCPIVDSLGAAIGRRLG